jgi:hypothetical protein
MQLDTLISLISILIFIFRAILSIYFWWPGARPVRKVALTNRRERGYSEYPSPLLHRDMTGPSAWPWAGDLRDVLGGGNTPRDRQDPKSGQRVHDAILRWRKGATEEWYAVSTQPGALRHICYRPRDRAKILLLHAKVRPGVGLLDGRGVMQRWMTAAIIITVVVEPA